MITKDNFIELYWKEFERGPGFSVDICGEECYELAKEMAMEFSKWVIDNRQYTVVGDAVIDPNSFELYIKSNNKK